MGYLDEAKQKLVHFEGSKQWMYLDTKGEITIGVGLLLASLTEAQKLPFVLKSDMKTPATKDQIKTGYAALEKRRKDGDFGQNWPAGKYENDTVIRLLDAEIENQLTKKVAAFEKELRAIFPDYDKDPDAVKKALIDMIYNLGATNLQTKFPKFTAAIKAKKWKDAAAESHRKGISDERNDYVRDLLLSA